MTPLRLRGGRLVDPVQGLDEVADLFVAEGRIAGLGRAPRGFAAARSLDARGLVVCPGFVDLGCRLREPGEEHKATIASEARAAGMAGFTTVCCTPDTTPVLDTPSVAEHIAQRAATAGGARVVCLGALTVGLGGEVLAEMHALKAAGCVGVTNLERSIVDTSVLKHALAYAASAGLRVFVHAEDYWLARQGCMHEGALSTRLGVPGIPAAAELVALHRYLTLAADTGVRAHFCRLSSGAAIRPVAEARRAGLDVTADTSLLHLSFTVDDVDGYAANLHVRPPVRLARDRAELRKAVMRRAIDAVGAYHEPHDADAKAAPFALTEPGASTLDTFLPALLAVVEAGAFSLPIAIEAASVAPRRVLGIGGGTLAPGAPADLCAFDPALAWTAAAADLASAGKNNPWLGQPLTGRVLLTLVGGRIVHDACGDRG